MKTGPVDARLVFHRRLGVGDSPFRLRRDALRGLTGSPKTIPSKYLYDARGSRLFEEITRLPEYYQTRTERRILERIASGLVARLRPSVLVEFGSGSATKTRVLLDAMREAGTLVGYGPLDVSEDASRRAARALLDAYPGLRVEGVIGDFEHPHDLPFAGERRLLAFLGSTIGNLEPPEAEGFLRNVASKMAPEDGFLVGFDLVKDPGMLERAYNDSAGVTAEFNLNVLSVLNRELGAEFDVEAFRHRARYDESARRIEMHLVSLRPQTVPIRALGIEVEFAEGETLRTELSHKYTRRSVAGLLAAADLRLDAWETDEERRFALGLALRSGPVP